MPDPTSTALSDSQKSDWNGLVQHLNGDYPTAAGVASYNAANPKSTITPDHIAPALAGVAAIKANADVPATPAYKNGNSMMYPVNSKGEHPNVGSDPSSIPKPNYDDPKSRLQYAQAFTKKYGALMQGRGDTPLRINETPDSGSDSAKNMSVKAASKYGLDPALLYSSAMEEGMSGLYADKNGKVDFSGDDKHPISGYQSFGLDTFSDKFPDLVKKGLLPANFAGKFVKSVEVPKSGDNSKAVNSANFVDTDSALQAKAAMVKDSQNQAEAYAAKNGITLSPKAKEFFALAAYNGGSGNMRKIMQNYNKAGALKDDNFIAHPPNQDYKTIHENVSRRILMRDGLKAEGLF